MCRCDYEFGGNFKHPLHSGRNPYKLWSLSVYFNAANVGTYLYIVFMLIVNEFWEDLIGTNVLGVCYDDNVRFWLSIHILKPLLTICIVHCCGLHELCCASKICCISTTTLLLDALIVAGSIYYCWLGLFYIYYGGDQYCNLPPSSPSPSGGTGTYEYADCSVVFLLLSFIGIHFVFIWLSAFRFVEIICFSLQRRRLNKLKRSPSRSRKGPHSEHSVKYDHQSVYESVDIDDLSKSIDDHAVDVVLPLDCNLEDIPEHEVGHHDHHRNVDDHPHGVGDDAADSHQPLKPLRSPKCCKSPKSPKSPKSREFVKSLKSPKSAKSPISPRSPRSPNPHEMDFDINQWVAGLYVYGDDRRHRDERRSRNDLERDVMIGHEEEAAVLSAEDGDAEKLKVPEAPRRGTSLSELWKATTDIVTRGFILKLTAEDFCCVCWEEFEIGNEIAKLECGHVIHKQCAVEWFSESATCPTCRLPLRRTSK